jgi:hypothetical protein
MVQTKNSTTAYVVLILILWLAILGACYATGIIPPLANYHADITKFGACLDEPGDTPISTILKDVDKFYLCGTVEGTTNLEGTLYLFYADTVIFQKGLALKLGNFSVPIAVEQLDDFLVGSYHAEIAYEKQILAATSFQVTDNK